MNPLTTSNTPKSNLLYWYEPSSYAVSTNRVDNFLAALKNLYLIDKFQNKLVKLKGKKKNKKYTNILAGIAVNF